MKTFKLVGIYLIAVMACLNFTSCSDDEKNDEPKGANNALVGAWQIAKVETITRVNGEIIAKDVEVSTEDSQNYIRVFSTDNTWEAWQENSESRWLLDNSGTWSLKSGKLKLTYTKDGSVKTEEVMVSSISSDQLVLNFPEEWKGGFSSGDKWKEETTSKIETLVKVEKWGF